MTRSECEAVRLEAMDYYGFGPGAMKRTKVCSRCGAAVSGTNARCSVCGAALPKETLFDLYCTEHRCCPGCGAVLAQEDRFCPHCGKKLENHHQQGGEP